MKENTELQVKKLENQITAAAHEFVSDVVLNRSVYGDAYLEKLKSIWSSFYDETVFEAGDFVEWKPGMKNRRYPDYGQPVVVMELLEEPVFDSAKDSGSSYYREPLDVVLGFLDSDGDFVSFHFDSRRFQKYDAEKGRV